MKSVNKADLKETKSLVQEVGEQGVSGVKVGLGLPVLPFLLKRDRFPPARATTREEVEESEGHGPGAGWVLDLTLVRSSKPTFEAWGCQPRRRAVCCSASGYGGARH